MHIVDYEKVDNRGGIALLAMDQFFFKTKGDFVRSLL